MASNGIVHSIFDLPIIPECLAEPAITALGDDFSTLLALVDAVGLLETLETSRPRIPLLTPNKTAAFEAVPNDILDYLASNVTALTEVLTYHVIPGSNFFDEERWETTQRLTETRSIDSLSTKASKLSVETSLSLTV